MSKKIEPIAVGSVEWLGINDQARRELEFTMDGPVGDRHATATRKLDGHDGDFLKRCDLIRGAEVFNWRKWTAVSTEEVEATADDLGYGLPYGIYGENMRITGVFGLSKLPKGVLFVFPKLFVSQLILVNHEENGPCPTIGKRLAEHHGREELKALFVAAALNRRGLMGYPFSAGSVRVGDEVRVYPPVE